MVYSKFYRFTPEKCKKARPFHPYFLVHYIHLFTPRWLSCLLVTKVQFSHTTCEYLLHPNENFVMACTGKKPDVSNLHMRPLLLLRYLLLKVCRAYRETSATTTDKNSTGTGTATSEDKVYMKQPDGFITPGQEHATGVNSLMG